VDQEQGTRSSELTTQDSQLETHNTSLHAERDLLNRIMETSPVGITVFDLDGQIRFANALVQQIAGLPAAELKKLRYNAPIWPMMSEDGTPLADEEFPFVQVLRTGQPVRNARLVTELADGVRLALSANAAPLFDESGRMDGVVVSVEDITDRLRAQELAELAAAAAERERLARDLHDAVTQTLFSVAAIAEALPRVWERDPAEGRRGLEDLRLLTQGALAEMRTLLLELRPAALTETSLGALLRQLGDAMVGRTQMPVTTTVKGEYRLPADVQIALYRIAQEALSNIARHARAGQATVSLSCEPGRVLLSISDDGCGLDLRDVRDQQMGLKIMRERAQGIGAELEVSGRPGRGTEVVVRWRDESGEG